MWKRELRDGERASRAGTKGKASGQWVLVTAVACNRTYCILSPFITVLQPKSPAHGGWSPDWLLSFPLVAIDVVPPAPTLHMSTRVDDTRK